MILSTLTLKVRRTYIHGIKLCSLALHVAPKNRLKFLERENLLQNGT